VSTETLATTLAYDGDAPAGAHSASIDGRTIGIGLARIEA